MVDIKKAKKPGNTTCKTNEQPGPEGVDTVDNLPIEPESEITCQETSEETGEDSGVARVIAEDNNEVFLDDDTLSENTDGDSVTTTITSINPTVDSNKDFGGENASSRVSEITAIEKAGLCRVSSVPTLPSGNKKRQESNVENTGNFQRSSSLRVRGARKVEQLRVCMEAKAASDENLTEFALKKKGITESTEENICLKEADAESQHGKLTEKESLEEDTSAAETEMEPKDRGSLPSELHGVLESGFVKRKSKNFEEGVYNVPSVMQVLEDSENLEEEMDVEHETVESDESSVAEELSESTLNEEPEPGVVRKHKEEYELKHRESLKRGAVLQRVGSGDGNSLKREKDECDSDSAAKQGSETDRDCTVHVDALVQKVNEDMRKEVSTRRISKKELELRTFVKQAGEQMKDALVSEYSETDVNSQETTELPVAGVIKGNTFEEKLQENPQLTGKSAECTFESKGESTNEGLTDTDVNRFQEVSAELSGLSEDKEDITSEQDKESVPHKGLVKRHTLLIEGRLQPFDQKSDKEAEDEDEKEGEPIVDQELDAGLPLKGETTSLTWENEALQPSAAENLSAEVETESAEQDTCDLSSERKDEASEQDTENVPERGLVKRHTLLIEGRLQPEQVLIKDAENLANKESNEDHQETCPLPSTEETISTASDSETVDPWPGSNVTAGVEQTEKETNTIERKETCELAEDREDSASEQDIENVLQKGLVKRHTLLIEERLQPFGQDVDKDATIQDEVKDESLVKQKTCPVTSSEETGAEQMQSVSLGDSVGDKSTSTGDETDKTEYRKGKNSEQDAELPSQRGLVKRHTLLIEGKLQPFDQDAENEDKEQGEATVWQEACSSASVDQQQRYQIERTSKPITGEAEEESQDGETVSGLVKREKMRIEERAKPTVVEATEPKQDEDQMVTCNDGATLRAGDGMDECCGETEKSDTEKDDKSGEQLMEQEHGEVGVDTSSVVRVKDHTQHLEGIIRITTTSAKDGEKVRRQTSKEDLPSSSEEPPKIVIVPRSCSDERVDQGTELGSSEKLLEDRMEEILSDSAVNIALLKAQESLDLENEKFVGWDVANVKQRTRIFEEIVRHFDNRQGDDSNNPIRRCGSMPKTIRPSQKYVFRRRSFSDLTETVSSSSGRAVGYTIQFSNGESSSSSSLPRDWSPLQEWQRKEAWDGRKTEEVSSPEIYLQDGRNEKSSVELIDCRDKENCSLSVKEKIQVLDSKNQKNISNVS